MAEIVNLNRARKAKVRAVKDVDAAANRAKHGRTREEKDAVAKEEERRDHLLDGARRED